MTQKDNDRVKDLFAVGVQDWTPVSVSHACCVLYAPFAREAEEPNPYAAVLSGSERQRAGRFITEQHKHHFIQRRAFRRYCGAIAVGSLQPLSQIVFDETDKGHPYLSERPDLWFSFSSCALGFIGAWSSTHGIGVDIEDKTRNVETTDLAQRFFSEAEAKAVKRERDLERRWTFFQLWCLKEAALKSIGEGLPFGLDAFQFNLTTDVRIVHAPDEHGGLEQFNAHLIEETDISAALVIRSVA